MLMRIAFLLVFVLYSAVAWYVKQNWSVDAQPPLVLLLTATVSLLVVPYLWFFKSKKPIFDWRVVALVGFVTASSTPTVLQTDQIRYVWDGFLTVRGENPYAKAPGTYKEQKRWFWMEYLNHPLYRTIYPPAAQGAFAVGVLINPWLKPYLDPDREHERTDQQWQIEIGWKVVCGLMVVVIVFAMRRYRPDLLIAHPLFLWLGLGNGHVDLMFAMFMSLLICFRGGFFRFLMVTGAVLTKWLPLMFVPLLFVHEWRKRKFLAVLSVTSLAIASGAGVWYLNQDINNGVFDSLWIYSRNWYFLGYVHGYLNNIFDWSGVEDHAHLARQVCGVLFLGIAFAIFVAKLLTRISLQLACLLIYLGYMVVSPTLHPWYLLPLIVLGHRFRNVILMPWIWGLISIYTLIYYYDFYDRIWLRWFIYFGITWLFAKDLGRLMRHFQKKRISFRAQKPIESARQSEA